MHARSHMPPGIPPRRLGFRWLSAEVIEPRKGFGGRRPQNRARRPDPLQPHAQALAVSDGIILALGSDEAIAHYLGPAEVGFGPLEPLERGSSPSLRTLTGARAT